MVSVQNPSFGILLGIIRVKQCNSQPLLKWLCNNWIEMVMRSRRATGKYIRDRIEDNDLWTRFKSFLTDEFSVGDWRAPRAKRVLLLQCN